MTTTQEKEQPWHASFPAPRNTEPQVVKRDEMMDMFKSGGTKKAGRDFLLVDVRKNDHEGGTIQSSINLPAQSLYHSLSTLYTLVKSAGIPLVVFYCGSCGGRGPRAAGWFADYIEDQTSRSSDASSPSPIKSAILQGGIKGWVAGGEEYTRYMDGFEKGVWEKSKTT